MSKPLSPLSSSTTFTPNSHSARSSKRPTLNPVVTTPPWARDEPPSPKETSEPTLQHDPLTHQITRASRPSDVASQNSSNYEASPWWSFTHPRFKDVPLLPPNIQLERPERTKLSLRDRSISWLPHNLKEASPTSWRREKEPGSTTPKIENSNVTPWTIPGLSPPPQGSFTISHNETPGWETPWSARVPNSDGSADHSYGLVEQNASDNPDDNKHLTPWQRRKKQFRLFMLSNIYVPLLFRFLNITFTTASLGIAIQIRRVERRNGVLGALGASPVLVIIFAPPTLVHVLSAIYLEYFGRPLGLWRTSHKLAHTLFEVLFICMWSAALSLCFDNFFTSLVPCAHASQISWYSRLPRPQSPITPSLDGVADELCDDQLALICLTAVGLIMYCTNLIISLFRIFEKVKIHQTALTA